MPSIFYPTFFSFAIESYMYETDFTLGLSKKISLLSSKMVWFKVIQSSNYVQNAFWQSGSDSRKFLSKKLKKKKLNGKCHEK